MDISVIDGSSYFKGLLLLIRRDNKISKEEQSLITRIGKTLGFEKKFVENAVNEILDNKHISTDPPVFSTKELAEKFIKDGFTIAVSDKKIHPHEEAWLYTVANENKIEKELLIKLKKNILENGRNSRQLEVDSIKVLY